MFVVLGGHKERIVDIIRSWFHWLSSPRTWIATAFTVAILIVASGLVAGWAATPVYLMVLAALAFGMGPFGDTYMLARFARRWTRYRLPGAAPAPSRRRFVVATVVQAALIALAIAGCWLYLGSGWDTLPLRNFWSPWVAVLIPLTPVVYAEVTATQRIREELRRRAQVATAPGGAT